VSRMGVCCGVLGPLCEPSRWALDVKRWGLGTIDETGEKGWGLGGC